MTMVPRRFRIASQLMTLLNSLPLLAGSWLIVDLWQTAFFPEGIYIVDRQGLAKAVTAWFAPGVLIFLGHLRACFPTSRRYILVLWLATLVYNATLLGLTISVPFPLSLLGLWQGATCVVSVLLMASMPMDAPPEAS